MSTAFILAIIGGMLESLFKRHRKEQHKMSPEAEQFKTFTMVRRQAYAGADQHASIGRVSAQLLAQCVGQIVMQRTSNVLYILDSCHGVLIEIDRHCNGFRRLLERLDLPLNDKAIKDLINCARGLAIETYIHRIGWHDHKNGTAYIYSQGIEVFAVSSSEIRVIRNGDEGVFFLQEFGASPFRMVENVTTSDRFDRLISSFMSPAHGLTSSEQSLFLLSNWFCCQFLSPLVAKLPALALVGPSGSNKTLLGRLIGQLLIGDSSTIDRPQYDCKLFDEAITMRGFLVIDDLTEMPSWLPGRIEGVVNRESITLPSSRRTMSIRYHLDCRLVITARDLLQDSLRKLGNLLVIELTQQSSLLESQVLRNASAARNEIMTSVLHRFQEILQALEAPGPDYTGSYQAGDLANIAVRHARVYHPKADRSVAEAFDRLATVNSRAMTTPENPLYRVLELWVADNQGRPVTPPILRKELLDVADKNGLELQLPCRIGHMINKMWPELLELYRVTTGKIGARYKQLTFWFLPPSEPLSDTDHPAEK